MQKHKITTLTELEREKKKLSMRMEISKREVVHSVGVMRGEVKNFLIRKVAIPAGVLGLSAYGVKKMTSSSDTSEQKVIEKKPPLLIRLLPIVIPLIKSYFEQNKNSQ